VTLIHNHRHSVAFTAVFVPVSVRSIFYTKVFYVNYW